MTRETLVAGALLLPAIAAPTALGQKIYWVTHDQLKRADLDGSQVEVLPGQPQSPRAMALDLIDENLFWAELVGGRLKRADLNALLVEDVGVLAPTVGGLQVHPSGALYWTETHLGRIRRLSPGASSPEDLIITPQFAEPRALALDLISGWMYWSEKNLIRRADLDGAGPEPVVSGDSTVLSLAIDGQGGWIYWSDFTGIQRIAASRQPQTLVPVPADGIALDIADGRIYWSRSGGIHRAGLDGTGIELLVQDDFVNALALDPRECSGHGQQSKDQCVCDRDWAGDNCGCFTGGCPGGCSDQGECDCGVCLCDAGWAGEDCACSTECPADCSGHGDCVCGACACDAQYTGEDCSCFTGGCPNDCSGHGECDCGECVCAPGWDGPDCSCEPQDCPNDCSGHGVCICGACDCAAGWVEPDCSVQTKSPARVFMAPDGLQQFAAPMGPTTYLTPAGTTVSVLAWMEDVTPTGGPLNAYQLIWSFHAHPLEGASGWVEYVDHDPGQPGGNSLVVDVTRPDWIFADTIQQPVYYNETPGIGIFGVFYATVPFLFVNPAELGDIRYLAEFELQVSPDASGVFEFKFNLFPEPPPLSYLYKPFGGAYPLDEYQPLRLVVGQTQPLTSEPPHQAIDPRQGSADGAEGGATLQLIYNGPAPDVAATDFGVEVSTGDPPQIEDLTADGVTVTLSFDRPFPGGACTTVRHLPSDWRVTIRALPGDVNGDGLTSPGDIITLVDQFNGAKQPPLKTWQCDINLSGECEPRDILALVDLLNGGGIQEAWNGVQAPECP